MIAHEEFEEDCKCHGGDHGKSGRGEEAQHHRENIADGIQNTVTEIVERYRRFAITIDDEIGVLEDFPGTLDAGGQCKLCGKTPARTNEVHQPIEDEAMHNVGEGVPVGNVLRIFGTVDDAMPELDTSTFADGFTTHGEQDDGEDECEGEGPEKARASHDDAIARMPTSVKAVPLRHACGVPPLPQAGEDKYFFLARFRESGIAKR